MNQIDFNSPEYKRSRKAYTAQCTFEYFIALLVADAFLAKLLTSIGISDALTGIISSFISLAFIIQIFSIFLLKANISTKKLVIIFDTLSQLFFMLLYIIPFLPVEKSVKTLLVVLFILIAYAGKYLVISICYKWANDYVEPKKRASFSATKEIISLISGIIFTLAAGAVVDKFEALDNLSGGFLFIAVAMLIINICNFICLTMIKKEGQKERESNSKPLREVIKHTLGNKNFRSIIWLSVFWEIARYFSMGFMGVFKTKDLLLSVAAVQVINMVANFARIIVSKPFGRYSDKTSFAKGFELALYIAAAGFLINAFTTQNRWYLIIVFTILYNICMAGINANSFNISYSYVDSEYITQAMAFKNSISGIFGFVASLLGGKILSLVQANGNNVFGIPMYGQQFLSVISFAFVIVTIIFMRKVVMKQEIKIQ